MNFCPRCWKFMFSFNTNVLGWFSSGRTESVKNLCKPAFCLLDRRFGNAVVEHQFFGGRSLRAPQAIAARFNWNQLVRERFDQAASMQATKGFSVDSVKNLRCSFLKGDKSAQNRFYIAWSNHVTLARMLMWMDLHRFSDLNAILVPIPLIVFLI